MSSSPTRLTLSANYKELFVSPLSANYKELFVSLYRPDITARVDWA